MSSYSISDNSHFPMGRCVIYSGDLVLFGGFDCTNFEANELTGISWLAEWEALLPDNCRFVPFHIRLIHCLDGTLY